MPSKSFDKIFSDLFKGELVENQEGLQRAISDEIKRTKEVSKKTLFEKQSAINKKQVGEENRPKSVQRPLTKEEAEIVEDEIKELKARITSINKKIGFAESSIIEQQEANESSPSFSFDISKRPRLKRQAKSVFGKRVKDITFEMYRELLAEKHLLEKEDGNSMFEDDEEQNLAESFVSLIKGKK
jgi:hypothetical protein